MFAAGIKSLIYCDSFRITKTVCCSIFRGRLTEQLTLKSTSRKHFSYKILGSRDRKPVICPVKINKLLDRQIVTKSKEKIKPLRLKTILISVAIGTGFLLLMRYLRLEKLKRRDAQKITHMGEMKIGGKFDLVDQDNKRVTSDDLLGNWLLIYFGFTHCPDICPDEIEKMIEVVDLIEKEGDMAKVTPLFITVDPERDSPGVVKKYLKEFSDKIIGLTGTVEQIAEVCKAYRVYFSPGPKDSDSDYIVDHSIIMYLVNPDGKFMDYFGQNKNANDIVYGIRMNQIKCNAIKSRLQRALDYFSKE